MITTARRILCSSFFWRTSWRCLRLDFALDISLLFYLVKIGMILFLNLNSIRF